MYKRITLRNMEPSEALEKFANENLVKIETVLEGENEPKYLEVVLTAERTHHHHRAECILKTPNYDLFTSSEGPDMYEVTKDVIDTMHRDLLKKKQERIDERKDVHKREIK